MDDKPETSVADVVQCAACGGDVDILMTCLHVLCRNCAPKPASFTSGRRGSESVYVCPVCPSASTSHTTSHTTLHDGLNDASSAKSCASSRIAAQPCVSLRELKKRTSSEEHDVDLFQFDDDDEDDTEADDVKNEGDREGEEGETFSTSLIFPCPQHTHRDAEQYCLHCDLLACSKCVTSEHRRCGQHLVTCAEAVVARRPLLDALHSRLAGTLLEVQESLKVETARLQDIERQRQVLVGQIRAHREALLQALQAEELRLIGEVTARLDKEKVAVEERVSLGQGVARSAGGQLAVLEAVLSVKGEPEILPLLPGLQARLEGERMIRERTDSDPTCSPTAVTRLVFTPNPALQDVVLQAPLGQLSLDTDVIPAPVKKDADDVTLTLLSSFYARTREDTCDPLLTDLLLLPAGDVILTDRDNRCVKKFNATGHLLTRVPIPEVPSRIALVSNGKAAISVMNRKVLLFMSLLGTIRVLSRVKVKKAYCFLASAGSGLDPSGSEQQGQGPAPCQLLAATHHCDVIDVISESGALLRRLYTYKGEKVSLSRPLYLHVPHPKLPRHGPLAVPAALVVDSGRRLLLALTPEGQTAFTFRPKADSEQALECPLGVACVPGSGLILLADRDRNRLLLLSRKGGYLRQALGEAEGLHKPCALYTSLPHRLALTQVDGWVKIYRLD